MNPEIQSIVERLEKVEKQNRQMKRVALGASLLAVAFAVMGAQGSPRPVVAERFVVVDANGTERAVLGMAERGPALRLYDAKGKKRAEWESEPEETSLLFYGKRGNEQVALFANEAGFGLSSLTLEAVDGKSSFRASSEEDSAGLSLYESFPTKKPLAFLTTNSGKSRLQMNDSNGNQIWSAP